MMLKPTIFISCFLLLGSAIASDSQLSVDRNSGKIEYKLPKSLPKGDYKIWNLTKDTDVGIEINKKSMNEISGKVAIAKNAFDDKFALLDPDGLSVYEMEAAPRRPSATSASVTPPPIPPMTVAAATPPPIPPMIMVATTPSAESDKKILPEISTEPTTLSEELTADSDADTSTMIDSD